MLRVKLGADRAERKLLALAAAIDPINEEALKNVGEKVVQAIHHTLDAQLVEGPALSDTTVRIKGHSMKLLDTHEMRNNVEARLDGTKAVVVGVHKDAPDNRGLIAAIHEHGSDTLPRRAFIEPSWNRVKRKVLREYDMEIRAKVLLLDVIT